MPEGPRRTGEDPRGAGLRACGMGGEEDRRDHRKWEGHLFPEGLEGISVPTTNNGLERVFRRTRRNVRKGCGDMATGRQLTL